MEQPPALPPHIAELPVIERFAALIDSLCAAIMAELAPRSWFSALFRALSRPMAERLCAMLRGISADVRAVAADLAAGTAALAERAAPGAWDARPASPRAARGQVGAAGPGGPPPAARRRAVAGSDATNPAYDGAKPAMSGMGRPLRGSTPRWARRPGIMIAAGGDARPQTDVRAWACEPRRATGQGRGRAGAPPARREGRCLIWRPEAGVEHLRILLLYRNILPWGGLAVAG